MATSGRRTADAVKVSGRFRLPAGPLELSALQWAHADGSFAGKRALLVHGLASNALLWQPAAHALAALGWECVAVDLRGHGHSDKPDEGYDHHTVAGDCSQALDALGWDAAVVMGQSWGANIAIELARADSRIRGAVAVDGGTIELGSVFPTWDACESALAPPRFQGVAAQEMAENMRNWHRDWSDLAIEGALGCFEVLPDGTVRPWLERHRHLAILHDLWAHKVTEAYPKISCPVLFTPADSGDVGWSRNKRESIERALEKLPDGAVTWFPGADHDLHAQKPDEFAAAVDTWWGANS